MAAQQAEQKKLKKHCNLYGCCLMHQFHALRLKTRLGVSRLVSENLIKLYNHGGSDMMPARRHAFGLKKLPLLRETNRLPGDNKTRRANQTPSGQNNLGPSPDRWKNRSRTYSGIANAMAAQWVE
jgi:hypothetical protein